MKRTLKLLLQNLGTVLIIALVLCIAIIGHFILLSLKQEPAQAELSEPALEVEVVSVQPENVPVTIVGYGEARNLNTVSVAPEVSGAVVAVHPRLEVGEVIPAGEVLLQIDARDYRATVDQMEAQIVQWESSIASLRKQAEVDAERLETLRRSAELAEAEYHRLRKLLDESEVGTQSNVDNAEMRFNQALDAKDMLERTVDLYPLNIREAESRLTAGRAQLEIARANLARTEVKAPFEARLKEVNVEYGQFVRAGEPVLTLADDSVVEISVPLDSRDVSAWLQFEDAPNPAGSSWFGPLMPVTCQVRWTEDETLAAWTATLDRVVKFDEQTRTVTVAVRVPASDSRKSGSIPLVDGMFCKVEIPGKTMQNVYRLPRWAVSYEGQVYIAREGRLARKAVEVAHTQEDEAIISSGLVPGDQVIVTRLVDPLPNSLLQIQPAATDAVS